MSRTKLIKYVSKTSVAFAVTLVCSSYTAPERIEKLSLDLMARTLFNGQSVTGHGSVYYSIQDGRLVTKMNTPFNQLIQTSAIGEYKSYDFLKNEVTLMQGAEFSSKGSFLHTFLSGKTNDMGLKDMGYRQVESKVEDGLLVTIWHAPTDRNVNAKTVKVVYENYLPIFMGFYALNDELIQKTYYTNYQPISFTQVPMTITEIGFIGDTDSTITQRKYSNLKTNNAIDDQWLKFEIPSDAKVVTSTSPSLINNQ